MILPFACIFSKLVNLRYSSADPSGRMARCLLVVGRNHIGFVDLDTQEPLIFKLGWTATCVEMVSRDVLRGSFFDLVLLGGMGPALGRADPQNFLYTLDLATVMIQDLELNFMKQEQTRSKQTYTSLCCALEVGLAVVAASTSAGDVSFFEFLGSAAQSVDLQCSNWQDFRADPCGITALRMGTGLNHELLLYTLGNSCSEKVPSFQVWSFAPNTMTFSRHYTTSKPRSSGVGAGGAFQSPFAQRSSSSLLSSSSAAASSSSSASGELFSCIALDDVPGSVLLGSKSGNIYRNTGGTMSLHCQLPSLDCSVVGLLARHADVVVVTSDGKCHLLRRSDLVVLPDPSPGDSLGMISYIDRIQLDPSESDKLVVCNILGGLYFEEF